MGIHHWPAEHRQVLTGLWGGYKQSGGCWPNALHRATLANHLSLVSELLDRKADKSIRNKYRNTALDIARKLNFKEIALLLDDSEISSDDEYQAKVLLLATQNANVNVVADLIKRGARIDDVKSPVGETLIQTATRIPQIKKLKVFLICCLMLSRGITGWRYHQKKKVCV